MRDFQRSKVYAAQNVLHWLFDSASQTGNPMVTVNGVTVTLPPEAKFACVDSIQAYVQRVMFLPQVEQYKRFTPQVRQRKGTTKAHYQSGTIAIPLHRDGKWALREMVVLHELAHHLAPGDHHGPVFVSTFLTLLGVVLGPEAELVARMVFIDNGVKTAPAPKEVKGAGHEKNPQAGRTGTAAATRRQDYLDTGAGGANRGIGRAASPEGGDGRIAAPGGRRSGGNNRSSSGDDPYAEGAWGTVADTPKSAGKEKE